MYQQAAPKEILYSCSFSIRSAGMGTLKVLLPSPEKRKLDAGAVASNLFVLQPTQLKTRKGQRGSGLKLNQMGLLTCLHFSPFPNPFINSIEMGFALRLIMWLNNQHNYEILVERKFLILAVWFPFQY